MNIEKLFLKSNFIEKTFYYEETDSTNDRAKLEAINASFNTSIFVADYQSKGRGRLDRTWDMLKGKNLMFSLLLRPDINPIDSPKLTMVMAQAVFNVLSEYSTEIKIKWPNDIIVEGKKLCGILTEMSASSKKINYVIIGTGINCNQTEFPEGLKNKAISLRQITGSDIDRESILKKVIEEFEIMYYDFMANGIKNIIKLHRKNSAVIGKKIDIINGNMKKTGYVIDISETGELIIKFNDGLIKNVISGEIFIDGVYSYTIK